MRIWIGSRRDGRRCTARCVLFAIRMYSVLVCAWLACVLGACNNMHAAPCGDSPQATSTSPTPTSSSRGDIATNSVVRQSLNDAEQQALADGEPVLSLDYEDRSQDIPPLDLDVFDDGRVRLNGYPWKIDSGIVASIRKDAELLGFLTFKDVMTVQELPLPELVITIDCSGVRKSVRYVQISSSTVVSYMAQAKDHPIADHYVTYLLGQRLLDIKSGQPR